MSGKFPYKLLVTINSAENLPIADFTTSDPYVTVTVGEKQIGKTKVVYKNHINPMWQESFSVDLLHHNEKLLLRVCDEDDGQDDDVMGLVTIDLSTVPKNRMINQTRELEQCSNIKARGTLNVSFMLRKVDNIVTIMKNELTAKKIGKHVMNVFPAIEEELKMIRLSPAIEYALKAIFSSETHTPFFSKRLLHDLLMDAKSISSGNAAFALSEEVIHRSDLRLVGASRMDLSSKQFISDAPIEENCIQINLAGTAMGGPPSYVLLQLASRYSVWNWLMWLRVLYDVWSGEMTQKELPAWAAQGFYKGSIAIFSSSDGQSVRGMCSVSVGDPFNIVCIKRSGGAQIVSLENMVSVVTSVDSFVPDKYALHIALVQSSHSPAALYDAEADLSALEKNAFGSWSMSQRSLPPPPSSSPSRLFAATNNNPRRKRGDSEEQEEADDDTSHADSDISSPSQHHRPQQQQQGQDRHSWKTNNNDQCSATDGSSVRGDEDEEQQQHQHQLQEEEEERDSEWEQSSVAFSVLPLGIADGEKKKKGLLKRMGRKMKKTVQIVASHAHFSSNNSKLTSQALPPSRSSRTPSAAALGEGLGAGSGGSGGNVIKVSKNSHTSQHLAGLHITFECGPMLSHSTRKDHSSGSIYWHDALCIDAPEAEVLGTALAGATPERAIDIAMFYGIYGMESCRGQLHLPLSRLIPNEERAKPNFLESHTSRIFETEVAITHKTVFSVTLLHAQGLALPAAVIKKGASSSSCTISAKCKLVTGAWKSRVDRSGAEVKSSTKTPLILNDNDNDEGSGIVMGNDNDAASFAGARAGTAASATFQDTLFLLKAPDSSSAHHHQEVVQYLRVELLVSPSAGKKETPVGVAFVPLHTISEQARDVTVELSRFKVPGLDKLQTSGKDRRVQGDLGLGKLSLRCQRITEDNFAPAASSTSALSRLSLHRNNNNNNNIVAAASGGGGGADIHAQNGDLHLQHNSYRPYLKLRTTVREQGVENTLYYCEGMLSGGNIDRHADTAEHYLLMAHPDALLLVENSAARERAERIACSSATSVAGAGGGAGKGTSKSLSRRPVSLLQRGVSVGSTGSSGHTGNSDIDDYDDDNDNDDGGNDDQSSAARSARRAEQEEEEDDEVDDEEGDDENNDNNNDTPRSVIAVFELHHRGTMPPFEWIAGGSHARPQFSDLEAKARYEFRSIEEAKVPVGYTWLDNNDGSAGWVVDKEYLNTDEEGWIYGSSFAKLLKDSLAGVSSVSPFNHHIRRRKWVRAVRALTVAERDQAVNASLNGGGNGDDGDDRSAAHQTDRGSLQHAQSVGMHSIGGVSEAFAIANCAQISQMMTAKTTTASMDVSSTLEAERKKRGIEWRLARHSRKCESAKENNNSTSGAKRLRRPKLLQNGGDASDLLAMCAEREVSHSSVVAATAATAADGEGGPIRIPWRNVKSVALVTDSVLYVQAEVQRFFPDPGSRSGTFRPALVDLFVSNCPALHLKSLLQERTIFAQFRECLKQLIKVGTLSGEASSLDEQKGGLASHSGEGHQTDGDLVEGDEDEAVPETEELSFGAELFSDMDHEAVLIEAEIDRLQRLIQRRRLRASAAAVAAAKAAKLAGKPVVLSPEAAVQVADVASAPLVEEISVLVRRLCRLRVYMATLIGAGLRHDAASGGGKSGMSFSLRSAQRNIQRDMQRYQAIDLGNDVLTANNRIEFLLDTAELRIRESAVGGWEHQQLRNKQQQLQLQQQQRTRFCVVVEGDEENDDNNNEISGDYESEKKSTGGLEGCIEAYVNGYLTEIAGILGMFFDQKKLENVKGLQSKINLINTFMKHNDRLDDILQGSLQPYGLAPTPAPKLSLFLNFEILLAWYNQILLFEMRERVKEVLAVWRDKEKDVSGQAEHYQYPLPWTPQRLNGDSGTFMTAIPEDTVEFLMTYLSYARIREEDVAPSFRRSIGRLDNKVLLTFASTFLFLSEEYVRALSFKDWTVTCEDELVEYSEWLCSVANDAQRVIDCEMLQPVGMSLSEEAELGHEDDTGAKLLEVTGRTIAAWDGMRMDALDHLSCLLFTFLFHHYDGYLDPDQFCVVWRKLVLRSHRHHKQQHQQQGLSPQGQQQGKSSAVSTKTTTIASTAKTLKKRASSVFFEQHAANDENGDAEEEDVCFTDLVNVFIDSLADKADFLGVHCYVQLLQICGGKLTTFYLSFLRTSKRHGFYFKPTGPEVRQVGRDIDCIKLGFERCLRALPPADRAEYHDTVMDIFAVLDHSLNLLHYDLNSPQFVSTLDFFSQYICARPATADAVAELVEHCLGLSGVQKFRDPAGHCNPTTGETVEPVPSVASFDDTPAVFAHQNEKGEVDLELVGQGRHEMHSLHQLQAAHRQEKNDKRRKESFIVSKSYATADHTAAKNASPFTRLGESEADQATTTMMVDSIGRLSDSADTDTDMSAGKNGGGHVEHRTLTGRKNLQAAESLYGSVMQLASFSRSEKNKTISLSHRPPLTPSLLAADLSGSESTDAELRNEAAIMANDVFLMWVFESISALRLLGDDIHGHGHGHWHGGRVRSLIAYTPVFRAFDNTVLATTSLKAHMVQSAFPRSRHDRCLNPCTREAKHESASSHHGKKKQVRGGGGFFEALFSVDHKDNNQLMRTASRRFNKHPSQLALATRSGRKNKGKGNGKKNSSSDSDIGETVDKGCNSLDQYLQDDADILLVAGSSSEDEGELLGTIKISDIQAADLFFLDFMSSPKPYLRIDLDGVPVATSSVKTGGGSTACWANDISDHEKAYTVGIRDGAEQSSLRELTISLLYKGYLYDQLIGKVTVAFNPYDLPNFSARQFPLDCSDSPRAVAAGKLAEREGRTMPTLTFTVRSS